jgi:hypothetical protein
MASRVIGDMPTTIDMQPAATPAKLLIANVWGSHGQIAGITLSLPVTPAYTSYGA